MVGAGLTNVFPCCGRMSETPTRDRTPFLHDDEDSVQRPSGPWSKAIGSPWCRFVERSEQQFCELQQHRYDLKLEQTALWLERRDNEHTLALDSGSQCASHLMLYAYAHLHGQTDECKTSTALDHEGIAVRDGFKMGRDVRCRRNPP